MFLRDVLLHPVIKQEVATENEATSVDSGSISILTGLSVKNTTWRSLYSNPLEVEALVAVSVLLLLKVDAVDRLELKVKNVNQVLVVTVTRSSRQLFERLLVETRVVAVFTSNTTSDLLYCFSN